MCDEWKNDFVSFYEWAIANGYKEEKTPKGVNILTIDRIDNDGIYEPSNCRFVTNAVQAKNKRKSIPKERKHKICPICGKEFEVKQLKGAITCSRECGFKLRSINHVNTKNYTKICPMCGKPFNAKDHFKDRIYCSNECRNKSFSPIWEFNGESLRVVEWAEKTGINAHCLLHRKDMGWTMEEILNTPFRGKRHGST
jgi:hypothetical protein